MTKVTKIYGNENVYSEIYCVKNTFKWVFMDEDEQADYVIKNGTKLAEMNVGLDVVEACANLMSSSIEDNEVIVIVLR